MKEPLEGGLPGLGRAIERVYLNERVVFEGSPRGEVCRTKRQLLAVGRERQLIRPGAAEVSPGAASRLRSHNRTVPSPPADARTEPAGLKLSDCTNPVCPFSVAGLPGPSAPTCQTRMSDFVAPTSCLPSAEKASRPMPPFGKS